MVDLAGRHRRLAAEVEPAMLDVLRTGRYVGGPVVDAAEAELAAAFGWRRGVGVNSGTDALIYALLTLGIRPGDVVAVPAVSFFATAGAVCRVGAVPWLCDVLPDYPNLDPRQIPDGARAVLAVHLFGEACALPSLPMPVLDDAAQSIGADPPARAGVLAAASFYPTKTLGAYGDGGIVLTDDDGLAEAVRGLTHHGMRGLSYYAEPIAGHVGTNSRLDAVQAAGLRVHLRDLPRRVARRRAHATRYDAGLPPGIAPLRRSPGHPVHQYVVLTDDRDGLRAHLDAAGIDTAIYYPHPLSTMPALAGRARIPGPLPHAERFCRRCLALPVHEELTDDDVDRVLAATWSFRDR